MSNAYSGNPLNVVVANPVAISTTSNSSGLVLVTTTGAHGMSTSDNVYIAGAVGVVPGFYTITVTGSNTFTLDGSTFTSGGSGGTALDFSLGPAYTYAADGEFGSIESIVSMIQTMGDRSQYLQNQAITDHNYFRGQFASLLASNWATPIAMTTIKGSAIGMAACCYEPKIGRWVVVTYDSTSSTCAAEAHETRDGIHWARIGGAASLGNNSIVSDIAADGVGNMLAVSQCYFATNENSGAVQFWNGSTWTTETVPATHTEYNYNRCTWFNGQWVIIGNYGNTALHSTIHPFSMYGAAASLALSASYNSGNQLDATHYTTNYAIAQSNAILIACQCVAATSQVHSSAYSYMRTTDGSTWTFQTIPSNTGHALLDVTYDNEFGMFVAIFNGGSTSEVFISTDAINWFAQTSIPAVCSSIVAAGVAWVAMVSAAAAGGIQGYFSKDQGGSWNPVWNLDATGIVGDPNPTIFIRQVAKARPDNSQIMLLGYTDLALSFVTAAP